MAKKTATPAQKAARERNWNKAIIAGIRSNAIRMYKCKTTKDKEKSFLALMIDDLNSILQNWNK